MAKTTKKKSVIREGKNGLISEKQSVKTSTTKGKVVKGAVALALAAVAVTAAIALSRE